MTAGYKLIVYAASTNITALICSCRFWHAWYCRSLHAIYSCNSVAILNHVGYIKPMVWQNSCIIYNQMWESTALNVNNTPSLVLFTLYLKVIIFILILKVKYFCHIYSKLKSKVLYSKLSVFVIYFTSEVTFVVFLDVKILSFILF